MIRGLMKLWSPYRRVPPGNGNVKLKLIFPIKYARRLNMDCLAQSQPRHIKRGHSGLRIPETSVRLVKPDVRQMVRSMPPDRRADLFIAGFESWNPAACVVLL